MSGERNNTNQESEREMTTAIKAKKVTLIKNKSSKAAEKSYAKMRWLMQVEVSKSLGWHKWVAEVMVELSKFADNVECCSDYRVVKCGDRYEIAFGNTTPFGKMDASQLYDWCNRLPLRYMQQIADDYRQDLYN